MNAKLPMKDTAMRPFYTLPHFTVTRMDFGVTKLKSYTLNLLTVATL